MKSPKLEVKTSGAVPEAPQLAAATELAARAAAPAVVGNVLFGTAGWTDRSLIQSGLFYPASSRTAQARLEHYAHHFNVVEVDATYYALLARSISERWIEWTPPQFCFDVKAFPVLTGHPIEIARLPADLRKIVTQAADTGRVYPNQLPQELATEMEGRFFDFVEPLRQAGRLGCVMLQFPPWFTATRGNVRRVERIRARWPGVRFSVEFRHRSWLESDREQRVIDLLRELGMAYVVVDEPNVARGGVPPVVHVTLPELAVVRFHGQNTRGWSTKGASVAERFNYLYSPAELAAWVDGTRRLSAQARSVHAIFNNCVRNYAVLNAQGLSVLLADSAA